MKQKQNLSLLFFALLFSACAFGQYDANTPPQNGLPTGPEYWPWTQQVNQACFAIVGEDAITGIPTAPFRAKGLTVSTTASVQANSGYHQHTGAARPFPTMISQSNNGVTDGTGCVTYKWTSPGNFAGWVAFQSFAAGFAATGINSRYRFHDWTPAGGVALLKQYNERMTLVNMPFSNHPDPRHNPAGISNFLDYSRYGTPLTVDALFHISTVYFASTGILNGNSLQLDVLRGSVPDGGIADNEVGATPANPPYISYEYQSRSNEWHQLGVEWDVANPLLYTTKSTAYTLLVSIAYYNNCELGKADPNGGALPANAPGVPFPPAQSQFWSEQDVIHLVCGVTPKAKN